MKEEEEKIIMYVIDKIKDKFTNDSKENISGLAEYQLYILIKELYKSKEIGNADLFALFVKSSIQISCLGFREIPKSKRDILYGFTDFAKKDPLFDRNSCFDLSNFTDEDIDNIYNKFFSAKSVFKDKVMNAFMFLFCCVYSEQTSEQSLEVLKKYIYKYLVQTNNLSNQ